MLDPSDDAAGGSIPAASSSRRVRVLVVSWTPVWPLRGGAALRCSALLSRLQGMEVALLAPAPLPPGREGVSLRHRRRWGLSFNPDILHAFSPAAKRGAHGLTSRFRPDVLLAFGIWSVRLVAGLDPVLPMVADLSHVEYLTARQSRPRDPRALVLKVVERRAVRRASRIWVVSPEDRLRLTRLYPEARARTEVVANGVDLMQALPEPTSDPAVLFVGRQTFAPNRQAARFICTDIAPRVPELSFVVIGGSAPQRSANVEAIEDCQSLAPYYRRARVVCAPVFSGTGTRLKVLEAAMYGRPLVATRLAVEGYGFVPGTHYLEADSGQRFAAAIRRLLNDKALVRSITAAAREQVVRCHLWDDIAASARSRLLDLVS